MDEILKFLGIKELRPPQKKALELGILDKKKNFLISIPTGAGKTVIAEMALINHLLLDKGKKGVYIVPLKALASEKYEEFKKKYEKFGVRVALSIGDYDEDEDLENYDLIITTAEKFDSLWRHGIKLSDISVVVVDEIHVIGDSERGGTLEVLLTKLKELDVQIIGLSATIGNPEELSEWLNAELLLDNWRPVELRKGIYREGVIEYLDGEVKECQDIVKEVVKDNGSVIIFCPTKKKAENRALSLDLSDLLKKSEKRKLEEISEELLSLFDPPTELCKKLASCVRKGIAFHHSGLTYEHRKIIEKAFRERILKVICSTTTLAFGLNLPCRRVIISELKRYTRRGLTYIPIMEVQQCIGRAGRPGLDEYGEGILVAKDERDYLRALQCLTQKPEPIYSKLSNDSVLRTQILGLIATRYVLDEYDLEEFIKNTFYAYQYKNLDEIKKKIKEIIEFLEDCNFIKNFEVTPLGKKVSNLYLDPLSAKIMIDNIEVKDDLHLLYILCKCIEMKPLLRVYRKEEEELAEELLNYEIFISYENLEEFKTAKMLYDWINEVPEDEILKTYKVEPGILRYKVEVAKWLSYSLKEIAKILNKEVPNLELRLEYGAKEELLELLKIKYIGRVRARKLYSAGIRNREDIIKNPKKVANILGEKISKKIFEELGVRYGQQRLI
ncbi:DEAD/DEAH box helicase domain protein [Methanocaldococcus infernus ME]|uniref:ATP-dependent DNA helicase Hel308 n=1 Tax=Methanocaldococcus infernus (strain DSM 11812 / JCM 15783 / ME) TaxID=573063 RepID=D5VQF6_METIM|nr:DEAD/DEAH box helicase [Methanocaldococcus infernus]ADG12809.1 DEAD/DEAH box helicase domain protein [Methanocaldococcus infernus ME]